MNKEKSHKPDATPPSWADRFLEWYCSPELLDEIQGDLHEAFYIRVEKYGLRKAKLLFITEVFLFCKPSSFEKPVFTFNLTNMHSMFSNYLKIAWRNTLKNKVFSMINICGLALGLAACFLIMQYVRFELSYDRFHENADRIYRVTLERNQSSSQFLSATNHPEVGPALKTDFPEVEEYARVAPQSIFMGNTAAWSHVDEHNNVRVLANLIALPLVYLAVSNWLSNFAFHTNIGWMMFVIPAALLLVISLATVSFQTIKTGSVNPINSLRQE